LQHEAKRSGEEKRKGGTKGEQRRGRGKRKKTDEVKYIYHHSGGVSEGRNEKKRKGKKKGMQIRTSIMIGREEKKGERANFTLRGWGKVTERGKKKSRNPSQNEGEGRGKLITIPFCNRKRGREKREDRGKEKEKKKRKGISFSTGGRKRKKNTLIRGSGEAARGKEKKGKKT